MADAYGLVGASDTPAKATPLPLIENFGENPGNLRMYLHAPTTQLGRPRALLVVLHGCGQTAADYDAGSGWSQVADAHDFLLLYPEQSAANNPRKCFNWFEPDDVTRGCGEAASIARMVAWTAEHFAVDRERVFICGLSAGGAMSAAMLAAYPDLFVGGAVIAGLPVGAARNVHEAVDSMYVGRSRTPQEWGDRVRACQPADARRPNVAIWHGLADATVKPLNGGELVKQWTDVHGLASSAPVEDEVGTAVRRRWLDAAGRARVTEYVISDLGHGVPTNHGAAARPFFLPVGLSSTQCIARDFGLLEKASPADRALRYVAGLAGVRLQARVAVADRPLGRAGA